MIYVDMDGVLADFDAGMDALYGPDFDYDDIAEQFWNVDCISHRFFTLLPPIDAGLSLLAEIVDAGWQVSIMSSTGGGEHHADIARQKIDWLHNHFFDQIPMAFCLNTKSKASFANPEGLLIDDRLKVCHAWEDAGGAAIQFNNGLGMSLEDLEYVCPQCFERVE